MPPFYPLAIPAPAGDPAVASRRVLAEPECWICWYRSVGTGLVVAHWRRGDMIVGYDVRVGDARTDRNVLPCLVRRISEPNYPAFPNMPVAVVAPAVSPELHA